MEKIILKLVIVVILFSMAFTVPLEAAVNSAAFEESKYSVQELYKFNNSLAYVEKDFSGGAVIRYFNSKTLKQTYQVAFDRSVRVGPVAENYFVIHRTRKDISKEELYDRLVYSVKTGKDRVIAEKIALKGTTGAIRNDTVFAFEDAIYDFDRDFSMTDIKLLDTPLWNNKIPLSYCIDGKTYLFTPADLLLTAYPEVEGVTMDDYILRSERYGFIYIKDHSVFWAKPKGENSRICSYQPFDNEVSLDMNSIKQYGFNRKGDHISIIHSPESYVVIDLESGTFKFFDMPGSYHGIQFGHDDKTISLFYNYGRLAQQEWITDLSYRDKTGKMTSLSGSAHSIAFYKNYIVYDSEIVAMGMMDMSSNGINVLNVDTGEETKLSESHCTFTIVGENLYTETDSGSYVFDPNKKSFLPVSALKKYIGSGVYMVSRGADVTFQDAKKTPLTYFYGLSGRKVCAVLPGNKKGFLYDGKSIKNITLPDAKRYTKCNEFKIVDNYISYRYPVVKNRKTYTYIRIVKV